LSSVIDEELAAAAAAAAAAGSRCSDNMQKGEIALLFLTRRGTYTYIL